MIYHDLERLRALLWKAEADLARARLPI